MAERPTQKDDHGARQAPAHESVKNPEHEAQIPARSPRAIGGTAKTPKDDPAGQQGGTQGGGRSAK